MDLKHAASITAMGGGALGIVGSIIIYALKAPAIDSEIVCGVSGLILAAGFIGNIYLNCKPSQPLTRMRAHETPAPPISLPVTEPERVTPSPSLKAIAPLTPEPSISINPENDPHNTDIELTVVESKTQPNC